MTDQQYDDELRGVLFKNDRKATERDPDYKGEAQVRGEKFWLSAWIRESKSGRKYMALSLRPAEADHAGRTREAGSTTSAAR